MTATLKRLGDLAWQNAYLLLTITTLSWAGNAVASKAAVGEVSPFLLTMLRWIIVAAIILAIAWKDLVAAWPTLRARLLYVFAMGGIGFTAFNASFYVAAHYTTAINIGIIQGAMPVFVLVGTFLVFGTRIGVLQAVGVLVTLAGVIVVAAAGDVERLANLVLNSGDVIMLVGTTFYAGYAVYLRQKPDTPGLAFFGAIAFAALIATVPLVGYEAVAGSFQWPTLKGWLLLIYVSIFPSLISQIFFIRGVELIGSGRAGVFINLVPVFAAILAVIILGEPMATYHVVALALVLGGIWLAERGKA